MDSEIVRKGNCNDRSASTSRQLQALKQHHTGKLRLTDVKALFQLMQNQS
jgi:hypothetical protein